MNLLRRKFLLGAVVTLCAPLLLLWARDRAVDLSPPAGSVPTFGGNPQHTAVYQPAAVNLNRIKWSTTIDFNNTAALAHYAPPLITAANTVLVPVKIAATPTPTPPVQPTDAFRIDALDGTVTGPEEQKWRAQRDNGPEQKFST